MAQERKDRSSSQEKDPAVAIESLRVAAASSDAAAPAQSEERMSIFWRVFGGTILSIVAMLAATLYQRFDNALSDIRSDVSHLNQDLRKDITHLSEAQADLVKKDDVSTHFRSVWDSVKELQTDHAALGSIKERSALGLELFRSIESSQKDLAQQVQQLRQQQAREEERRALSLQIQQLQERLARLEAGQQRGVTAMPAVREKERP